MKLAVPLLLLISVSVSAQSAPSGQPPARDFDQVRQVMLGMMKKSLPALEQTRSCLAQSRSSRDLNQCAAIMLDFQRTARASMGIPEGGPHGKPLQPEDLNLQWSPEMKQTMLKDIDQSIRGTRAMVGCLESSNSDQEMTRCVQEAGLMKGKP